MAGMKKILVLRQIGILDNWQKKFTEKKMAYKPYHHSEPRILSVNEDGGVSSRITAVFETSVSRGVYENNVTRVSVDEDRNMSISFSKSRTDRYGSSPVCNMHVKIDHADIDGLIDFLQNVAKPFVSEADLVKTLAGTM